MEIPRITMPDSMRQALIATAWPDVTLLGDQAGQQEWLAKVGSSVSGFEELMREAEALLRQAGSVIMEGCVVEPDGAVALLGAHFGYVDPVGNGHPPRPVFDVTPRRDQDGNVSMSGSSRGAGFFEMHNDSASFVHPHTHIMLACVISQPGSGQSITIAADAIAGELARQGAVGSLAALADPVYPFLRGIVSPDEVVTGAVLYRSGDHWSARYSRQFLDAGLALRPLDSAHVRALRDFEAALGGPGLAVEFTLAPGEVWLVENDRWLHGRRAIDPRATRLLKRCKIYSR